MPAFVTQDCVSVLPISHVPVIQENHFRQFTLRYPRLGAATAQLFHRGPGLPYLELSEPGLTEKAPITFEQLSDIVYDDGGILLGVLQHKINPKKKKRRKGKSSSSDSRSRRCRIFGGAQEDDSDSSNKPFTMNLAPPGNESLTLEDGDKLIVLRREALA